MSDNIFFNIQMRGEPGVVVPAKYETTRLETIIEKPEDYYLSITRFSIPTTTLPIFSMEQYITTGDLTSLKLTFSKSGTEMSRQLLYTSSDLVSPVDSPKYYYVYTISDMVKMLNQQFELLVADFAAFLPTTTQAPYYVFDYNTRRLTLIVQQLFLDDDINVWMNIDLFNFIGHLGTVQFYGYNTDGKDYLFIFNDTQDELFKNDDNEYIPPGYVGPKLLGFEQDFSELVFWYDIGKIVFISNHLPSQKEYVPTLQQSGIDEGINASVAILMDFLPIYDSLTSNNRVLSFASNGPYQSKLIDMTSGVKLRKIDISVFWVSKSGTYNQLFLDPNNILDIQLAFFKKNSLSHKHLIDSELR